MPRLAVRSETRYCGVGRVASARSSHPRIALDARPAATVAAVRCSGLLVLARREATVRRISYKRREKLHPNIPSYRVLVDSAISPYVRRMARPSEICSALCPDVASQNDHALCARVAAPELKKLVEKPQRKGR